MADNVKVKITEKNGTQLTFVEEYALTPENIPFSSPIFTSTDTKAAIEEVATVSGKSRFILSAGYNSTLQNGRYLEFFRDNASNTHPFVVVDPTQITNLSASVPATVSTMTLTIYKNAVAVETLTFTNSTTATKTLSTPMTLVLNDKISIAKTAGDNAASVSAFIHCKVTF